MSVGDCFEILWDLSFNSFWIIFFQLKNTLVLSFLWGNGVRENCNKDIPK